MSDPYTAATSRLQSAIFRWLADHGVANPEIGAVELAHIVRGHGWRPMPGLQPPPEGRPAQGLPAEYLERKAALTARNERTPE